MSLGLHSDDTLETWLAAVARDMPARILVMIAVAGALLVALGWAQPSAATWPLTAVGVCGASFGVWSLCGQSLDHSPSHGGPAMERVKRMVLRLTHNVAAIVGVLAGVTLVVSIPMAFLGTWIS